MQGLHLTADLYNCRCAPAWLLDAPRLGEWCAAAAQAAGLEPVGQLVHACDADGQGPGGVTALVLLAESHLSIHTCPAQKTATLDVFVSNAGGGDPAKARRLMLALVERFAPEWTEQRALDRGDGA